MGGICNTRGRNGKGAQDDNVENFREHRMGDPGVPKH
jgi:hypothetical protein